jgi:hypothetical protein
MSGVKPRVGRRIFGGGAMNEMLRNFGHFWSVLLERFEEYFYLRRELLNKFSDTTAF